MARSDRIRVLTASEDATVHTTIARALALLGEEDAARIELIRADTAADTLSVAGNERPRVAFLDVTIGKGAGVGLVHFLQATVPGLIVVAIVPEGADRDVRLVEQAAALGASYVLLGELTGDDVLRAFTRVAPSFVPSRPPPPPPAAPAASAPPPVEPKPEASSKPESAPDGTAALADARSFGELSARVSALASSIPGSKKVLEDVRAAIERCLVQERADRSPMQDPSTSAYSFAYFVDLAGREIDLARRHARRFALATVDVRGAESAEGFDPRSAVELVLSAVRDTDVVARADERELLLLLPETGAKGARTLRRRIIERTQAQTRAITELPLRVGIASFPFDGEDLSRLLRIARRRAERWAPLDSSANGAAVVSGALEWLGHASPGDTPRPPMLGGLVPIDVPLRDAWALLDVVVRESTRAGDATIGLHAPHDGSESALGLAQGIRASTLEAIGPVSGAPASRRHEERGDMLSLLTGVSRLAEGVSFGGLEVVSILAEHACYGLLGRVEEGHLLALQGHDLPFVESLINGLEQPVLRRGSTRSSNGPSDSSAAPSSARSSRSDPAARRS